MQDHELRFTRQGGCSFPGLRIAGLFTALLLLLAGSASAQVSTASVNGVVRDPKGAVIPGATIVLSSVDTSVRAHIRVQRLRRVCLSQHYAGQLYAKRLGPGV